MGMVMSCREVLLAMSSYMDSDLDTSVMDIMTRHFAACRSCSAQLRSTRNVVELISDPRALRLPAGFADRLRNRFTQSVTVSKPN